MIAGTGICASFKNELLRGVHNFETDEFFVALFKPEAELSTQTEYYNPEGEVIGPGYQAGGQRLRNPLVQQAQRTAFVTFDDPVWPECTITARGALVYNWTRGRRAVAVLDFGGTQVSNSGEFRVRFPEQTPYAALIRIV